MPFCQNLIKERPSHPLQLTLVFSLILPRSHGYLLPPRARGHTSCIRPPHFLSQSPVPFFAPCQQLSGAATRPMTSRLAATTQIEQKARLELLQTFYFLEISKRTQPFSVSVCSHKCTLFQMVTATHSHRASICSTGLPEFSGENVDLANR